MLTKENKELLLKDLCARSLYGVMTDYVGECIKVKYVNPHLGMIYISYFGITKWEAVEVIKPYLRPMSSMTEEEENEWWEFNNKNTIVETHSYSIDWLNSHHFDYRNLIEHGLAIEASKGMYNIK